MGVTAYWIGRVDIEPPLSQEQQRAIEALVEDRGDRYRAIGNRCGWLATPDGSALVWDQREKFSAGRQWLESLLKSELAEHRADGTIFAFAEPEWMLYWAARIDVADSEVRERSFRIPYLRRDLLQVGWTEEEIEAQGSLGGVFFEITEINGRRPDYSAGARALDRFLEMAPLDLLGELAELMRMLVDYVGTEAEPVGAVIEKHARR